MVFPDDVLVEGERVLVHRHPHWRVLVGPALAFLLVVGAAGYVAALARNQGWQQWGWQGIQVPLDGITGARTKRTGRLGGVRSLLVETEAGEELEFVAVADAERVREALQSPPTG